MLDIQSSGNCIKFPMMYYSSCKSFINTLCLSTKLCNFNLKSKKVVKFYVHISPFFHSARVIQKNFAQEDQSEKQCNIYHVALITLNSFILSIDIEHVQLQKFKGNFFSYKR